jgi:hypothetical protein
MDTDVRPVTSDKLIVGRRYCLKEQDDDCEDLGVFVEKKIQC